MQQNYITIKSTEGAEFRAYQAIPESGQGPGLVMLQEIFGVNQHMRNVADHYAEEGYVVLVPDLFWRFEHGIELGYGADEFDTAFDYFQHFDVDAGIQDIAQTIATLENLPECDGKIGVIGFCLGGTLSFLTAARCNVACAVSYYGAGLQAYLDESVNVTCPTAFHCAEKDKYFPPEAVQELRDKFENRNDVSVYLYPDADHAFNRPEGHSYDKLAAQNAHSRTIALLRDNLGPHYDLASIWENHLQYEFGDPDVEKLMPTMVAQPYVNHIPTMTGGYGYEELRRFYKHHFLPSTPPDAELVPISRTIGADRLVDEFVFRFKHDREIDWLVPGISPTNKDVEIPMVGIICFRGDKLYNEHIYWDQASVLVQLEVLDPHELPIAGSETAAKLIDESRPSNELMPRWKESEDKSLD